MTLVEPRGSQIRAFRMPDIFLTVGAEDGPVSRDEVRGVVEPVAVFLDDGAGYQADLEFAGKGLVG